MVVALGYFQYDNGFEAVTLWYSWKKVFCKHTANSQENNSLPEENPYMGDPPENFTAFSPSPPASSFKKVVSLP